MIVFSAFPERKTSRKLWLVSLAIIALLGFVVSIVLLAMPGEAEKRLGWALFKAMVYLVSGASVIVLVVVIIWFFRGIMIPRLRGLTATSLPSNLSAYNSAEFFRQFSLDNGFRYEEYPTETPAPERLYAALINVTEKDSIYLLYEMTGNYNQTDFTLYCLAFAEGSSPLLAKRRGFGYEHDGSGRRVEYATVLLVPKSLPKRRWVALETVTQNDKTFIFCEGYVTNRSVLQDMFNILDN